MTRSVFDPTAPKPERSGSTFLGPQATNNSRMPSDVVDGVVELDQTDVMQVDAAGDEASGVTIDARSEPGAVIVEGEQLSNPGHEPAGSDSAAGGGASSDLDEIAKAERDLERQGRVDNPDRLARGVDGDSTNPGKDAVA
jgi:hypothetical protein